MLKLSTCLAPTCSTLVENIVDSLMFSWSEDCSFATWSIRYKYVRYKYVPYQNTEYQYVLLCHMLIALKMIFLGRNENRMLSGDPLIDST